MLVCVDCVMCVVYLPVAYWCELSVCLCLFCGIVSLNMIVMSQGVCFVLCFDLCYVVF